MEWLASSKIRFLLLAGLTAGAAMLLLFPPSEYAIYPACPVHAWTGLLCPGCGGTRALAALLRGHFADAWHWNQLLVSGIPLAAAYLGTGTAKGRWIQIPRPVWLSVAAVAAGFTVWRNLA